MNAHVSARAMIINVVLKLDRRPEKNLYNPMRRVIHTDNLAQVEDL